MSARCEQGSVTSEDASSSGQLLLPLVSFMCSVILPVEMWLHVYTCVEANVERQLNKPMNHYNDKICSVYDQLV